MRRAAIRVPSGRGTLEIARGIEVGHIFQLGQLYSEAMHATVLDEQGKSLTMFMGCYGIGVTRVVAAAIEQNHDANGIVWPEAIAPFQVVLVPDQLPEVDARASKRPMPCISNSRTPASTCCSTIAMPVRGSSSPIPNSWAFLIGSSSGTAASMPEISNIVTDARPSRRKFRPPIQ